MTVEDGAFDTHVIAVPDQQDDRQFLRVGKGELVREGSESYLPIGVVSVDYDGKRALVELPYEADSGSRRMWIPFNRFRTQVNGG